MTNLAMQASAPSVGWLTAVVGVLALGMAWRFSSLTATRGQKIGICAGIAFGFGALVAIAAAKHDSAATALIIFADVLAALLVSTFGNEGDLRHVFQEQAQGKSGATVSDRTTRRMLIAIMGVGVVAIGLEFLLHWL